MTNKQYAIKLIGLTKDEYVGDISDLGERIRRQFSYDKHIESIEKLLNKTSIAVDEIEKLFSNNNVQIIRNCGLEDRSRFCYTLFIDGKCIFTSGTIKKVIERIVQMG